ncbi:alpha-2,3-sialyltransferase [uncultured Roseibium sp.]|uniref:alpha-2,3-sialyltransferase n=1 Tax=uncultured Roseibium sp. TaxID=1936171 RepID=UPI002628E284|nr:alpha-2,3-sialyltransferase [uncultured Roseibium sp.]
MAFPKNYTNVQVEIERIKTHFGERLEKPCLIVGNGPSSRQPMLSEKEIEEYVIFRMNWFFLEKEKNYGSRVDGFFWSVDNAGLRAKLAEVTRHGSYKIGAYFQPFQPSNEAALVDYDEAEFLLPSFDHWAVLAQDPTLGRFFMGRPLPTQGMQAIGFAAVLGFKDIRLSGVDMYQNVQARYAWEVSEEVRKHLKPKDWKAGYEEKHSLDRDMLFLRAVRQRYKFQLTGISNMEKLAPILDADISIPNAKRTRNDNEKFLRKDYAYVTLADGQYKFGAIALARSLALVTDKPLIVFYTDPETPVALRDVSNVILKKVDPINNPHSHGQERFDGTFTKLHVFGLHDYKRVVFIDADCVVLDNIDELFDMDGIQVAPDWGEDITPQFNSGVLALSPSEECYKKLLHGIDRHQSNDGGDQGYLNEILKDQVHILPPEYNTLKRLPVMHPNLISLSQIKVLHFVGKKPWHLKGFDPKFSLLEQKWAQFLEKEDWIKIYWDNKYELIRNRNRKKEEKRNRLSKYGPIRRLIFSKGEEWLPRFISRPADKLLRRMRIL